MFDKRLDTIKNGFIKYLDSLGLSAKSHKNYRSDLNHFSAWTILKVRSFGSYIDSLTEAVPFLSNNFAGEYKRFMVENTVPIKTVNRRLSTLRHLARFMALNQIIDQNFMDGIENVSVRKKSAIIVDPLIGQFKAHLEAKKASPNTIKNYISDVRHFLNWVESHPEYHVK